MSRRPVVARQTLARLGLSSLVLVLPATRLAAQQGIGAPVDLPEITVSSSTVAQPIADVGSSVTVITGKDLAEQQRRTVPDALQTVPGLNVVQAGGPGSQTSIFIRGTNSNHVKVLIDGVDAGDPSSVVGAFDFGQLLTADIDRIEVLRGPQSGLYGSDAIGGVISIFTKRGEGPPKATLRVEGGSFGTFNQNMGFSGGTPIYDYSFNIAHQHVQNVPVTPPDLLPPGRQANGNLFDNWTLSGNVGVHLGDSVYANAVMRYIDSDLRFTGDDFNAFPSVPNALQSVQRNQNLYTRGELHYDPLGTTIKNRLGVSYTQAYATNKDPDTAFGPTPVNANLGQRIKYDYQGSVEVVKGQTIIVGAETQTDRLANATGPVTPFYAHIDNSAGYAELLSNFGNRVFLNSNVRHDENQNFGGATTFRVAPSVHIPVTETIIKGSYGTGFKAPTLNQLFVDFPAFGFFANPNLHPERSAGYDIGFEQPLPGNRVRGGATYYQNNITNLINTNNAFTTYVNVGRAKTYGAEAFVSVAVTPTLDVRTDYTFTIARDEILMQELLRRPRNRGSVQADWRPIDRLTLSATLIVVGRFLDVSRDGQTARLTNKGHTTANVAASYDLTPATRLFARVDNLFNLRYQEPTGFLRPGIGAYGGAQVRF